MSFNLKGEVVKILQTRKAAQGVEDYIILKCNVREIQKGANKGREYCDMIPIQVRQDHVVSTLKPGYEISCDVRISCFKWADVEVKEKIVSYGDERIKRPCLWPTVELEWGGPTYNPISIIKAFDKEEVLSKNEDVESHFIVPENSSTEEDDLPF